MTYTPGVDCWTYSPRTLDYRHDRVSPYKTITTCTFTKYAAPSKVRLKPDGTHKTTWPTNYPSIRTLDWQRATYERAIETGVW